MNLRSLMMKFKDVVDDFEAGKNIRRKEWVDGCYLSMSGLSDNYGCHECGDVLSLNDIIADDWQVETSRNEQLKDLIREDFSFSYLSKLLHQPLVDPCELLREIDRLISNRNGIFKFIDTLDIK